MEASPTTNIPTYISVDSTNTNKSSNLNELAITNLLLLSNIIADTCKEFSVDQKYICCCTAMKLVFGLAPFVTPTQELLDYIDQIRFKDQPERNSSGSGVRLEGELKTPISTKEIATGKGKERDGNQAPIVCNSSPGKAKQALAKGEEKIRESASRPIRHSRCSDSSPSSLPPIRRPSDDTNLTVEPVTHDTYPFSEFYSRQGQLRLPLTSHIFAPEYSSRHDLLPTSIDVAEGPLNIPDSRHQPLRREHSFVQVLRDGRYEMVSPYLAHLYEPDVGQGDGRWADGERRPVPIEVDWAPALPMLRYDVESSRNLHRENSFIEVDRGSYVEWVPPYAADIYTPLQAHQRRTPTDGLDLVPPIPGAMMPVYRYAESNVNSVDDEESDENSDDGSETSSSGSGSQEPCEDSQKTVVNDDAHASSKIVKIEDHDQNSNPLTVDAVPKTPLRDTATQTPSSRERKADAKRKREEEEEDVSPRPFTRPRSDEAKAKAKVNTVPTSDSNIPSVSSVSTSSGISLEANQIRRSPRSKSRSPQRQ